MHSKAKPVDSRGGPPHPRDHTHSASYPSDSTTAGVPAASQSVAVGMIARKVRVREAAGATLSKTDQTGWFQALAPMSRRMTLPSKLMRSAAS